jgi:transposase InsO family protein
MSGDGKTERCRLAQATAPITGSMGRRGNPYDNTKAESFMKTLKVEAVYLMAYETFEQPTFPASPLNYNTIRRRHLLRTGELAAAALGGSAKLIDDGEDYARTNKTTTNDVTFGHTSGAFSPQRRKTPFIFLQQCYERVRGGGLNRFLAVLQQAGRSAK